MTRGEGELGRVTYHVILHVVSAHQLGDWGQAPEDHIPIVPLHQSSAHRFVYWLTPSKPTYFRHIQPVLSRCIATNQTAGLVMWTSWRLSRALTGTSLPIEWITLHWQTMERNALNVQWMLLWFGHRSVPYILFNSLQPEFQTQYVEVQPLWVYHKIPWQISVEQSYITQVPNTSTQNKKAILPCMSRSYNRKLDFRIHPFYSIFFDFLVFWHDIFCILNWPWEGGFGGLTTKAYQRSSLKIWLAPQN